MNSKPFWGSNKLDIEDGGALPLWGSNKLDLVVEGALGYLEGNGYWEAGNRVLLQHQFLSPS